MEDNKILIYYSVKKVDSMSYLVGERFIIIPYQCYDLAKKKIYEMPKKLYEEITLQLNYIVKNNYNIVFEPDTLTWIQRIRIDMKSILNND